MARQHDFDAELERTLQRQIDEWESALAAKDALDLQRDYADDVVLFDVGTQVTGRKAYGNLWEACFPYFGTIGIERRDTRIHLSGDLAVLFGYTRLTGARSDADAAKSWLRTTVCYRRVGERWQVVHEHVSLPVDCEAEKPIYLLG